MGDIIPLHSLLGLLPSHWPPSAQLLAKGQLPSAWRSLWSGNRFKSVVQSLEITASLEGWVGYVVHASLACLLNFLKIWVYKFSLSQHIHVCIIYLFTSPRYETKDFLILLLILDINLKDKSFVSWWFNVPSLISSKAGHLLKYVYCPFAFLLLWIVLYNLCLYFYWVFYFFM